MRDEGRRVVDSMRRSSPAFAVGLLLFVCLVLDVSAADRPLGGRPAAGEDRDDDKERVATAAVFLLVLVLVAGGGLLIVVVLWGRSVRRAARKPTARIAPGDELWYLKPNKSGAAARPPASPDGEPPPANVPDPPEEE